MSILSDIFGGGKKNAPMDAANQYLNQIPGVGHQGYDPYVQQGQEAGTNVHSQYERMMNDPQAFIDNIMKQYKESEGYKYQSEKLGGAMSNTAAAGGIAGTPLDQMNQGEQLQKLLSGDQQQFLQNALGRYDTGLRGEEGEATRGYDASRNLTDLLGGSLNQQGGLAFQNAQQQNKDANERRNSMWSMFGKALGAGAGFAMGGPEGASAGYKLGGGAGNLFGGK